MIPAPPNPESGFGQPAFLEDDWLTGGVISRRVIAWLLDVALVGVLLGGGWLFCLVFGILTLGLGWPLFGLLPAVPLLYHWLSIAAFAATPGQVIMGLSVRNDDSLAPPTLWEALVFTLLFYVTIFSGAVWFAVALFTPRHRALHDIAAGLLVIRVRALTAPSRSWNMGFGTVPPGGSTAA